MDLHIKLIIQVLLLQMLAFTPLSFAENRDLQSLLGQAEIVRPEDPPQGECEGFPVHLSFDDGPSLNSEEVLNVLKEENVRATFFLAGAAVERSPSLARQVIRRQIEEGHQIAYHGYQHGDYARSFDYLDRQIRMTQSTLAEFSLTQNQRVSDFALPLFRLPGGDGWNSSIRYSKTPDAVSQIIRTRLRQEDWTHFGWHVDTRDYERGATRNIGRTISQLKANEGGVLLLHDIHRWSGNHAKHLIHRLRDEGFCFRGPEHFMMDESLQIRLRGEEENCGWK